MSLSEIHIAGYRWICDLRLPLRRLTVLVGGNEPAPPREVLRQDGATRITGLTRLGQFEDG
jgi:hypothetical protein